MPYYAVARGKKPGVYTDWNTCKIQVNGYRNARYKKFDTKEAAEHFVNEPSESENTNKSDNMTSPTCHHTDYYVYTDGACSRNGATNATAGIGIYFGENDARNVSRRISGKQTNNAAELTAIIEAYNIVEADIASGKTITIVSDSTYAIRCAREYGEKCMSKNWSETIPNKMLVKRAYEVYQNKSNVHFHYCKAHTSNTDPHSVGNYHADKLAVEALID